MSPGIHTHERQGLFLRKNREDNHNALSMIPHWCCEKLRGRDLKLWSVDIQLEDEPQTGKSLQISWPDLLTRVRVPPLAPWPDIRPESLRSSCCAKLKKKGPDIIDIVISDFRALLASGRAQTSDRRVPADRRAD
ncbi:hypothetical protein PoB_002225900 [Plakobranchus ocellatus]|uniref:Uncharacterized protein n=1 Tax=Plakobranchus ocellatus TaxID=259542 RepID=A0AAV3ZPD1_9GAST|nr:hypothetical protein PoB_002225900 [Plakobranchus ocellatus]